MVDRAFWCVQAQAAHAIYTANALASLTYSYTELATCDSLINVSDASIFRVSDSLKSKVNRHIFRVETFYE